MPEVANRLVSCGLLARVLRPVWVATLVTAVLTAAAGAHFLLNLNVRIFHVEHVADGLRVYHRTPMPYLVADKLGEEIAGGLPEPAPFTTNAREEGQVVHYLDPEQVAGDPLGIGRLAEAGLRLETDGSRLPGEVRAVQLHAVGSEPGFATLDEARLALSAGPSLGDLSQRPYVGDVVVDVLIHYPTGEGVQDYAISSLLDPGLPGQETTANLILDYGPGDPRVFRSRGLLDQPVTVTRSRLAAFGTFVREGVIHILEGVDHVLFVICLILGATGLHSLIWRVTGFTLGHSVTLTLGFFGYVPKGAWFIQAVEVGIALSIIYAAAIALWPRQAETAGMPRLFFVTVAIGLLHGLGFSFVLQRILQVDSPNIWQSLLAFNIGVELGQLMVVLVVYPIVSFLPRLSLGLWQVSRGVIALGCIAIAGVWTVERSSLLLVALQ